MKDTTLVRGRFFVLIAASAWFLAAPDAMAQSSADPASPQWSVPPVLPPGALIAVVSGDRTKRREMERRYRVKSFTYEQYEDCLRDVDAVYTDVWTSMGQEVEYAERKKTFKRYQVNEAMMALAKPGALFMHCLPAHRGEEVSDEVIESPISVVFDQAENRLHAQKALLVAMLKD